jgi:hypothetical protein
MILCGILLNIRLLCFSWSWFSFFLSCISPFIIVSRLSLSIVIWTTVVPQVHVSPKKKFHSSIQGKSGCGEEVEMRERERERNVRWRLNIWDEGPTAVSCSCHFRHERSIVFTRFLCMKSSVFCFLFFLTTTLILHYRDIIVFLLFSCKIPFVRVCYFFFSWHRHVMHVLQHIWTSRIK